MFLNPFYILTCYYIFFPDITKADIGVSALENCFAISLISTTLLAQFLFHKKAATLNKMAASIFS